MEEERRLAYVGITRAEKELYLTNADMRILYGKETQSSFPVHQRDPDHLLEIPEGSLTADREDEADDFPFGELFTRGGGSGFGPFGRQSSGFSSRKKRGPVIRPAGNPGADTTSWKPGDKAMHQKWGIGTVVAVRNEGESMELDIAFPSPVGIKRLLAKFAPITKV